MSQFTFTFMRPIHIPVYIQQLYQSKPSVLAAQPLIATAYQALRKSGPPDVSIVMPAYNEEENILQTLLSIANNETKWAVEIVVVNNNSKDQTESPC